MTTALPTPISATASDLPPAVAAALAEPIAGRRSILPAAGIPFSSLSWGAPDDPPLVLIHGVTASAAVWWRIGPALAATGRRVVAIDLPGHGLTGHWSGRHRFDDMAADVAIWIREAGLDRPELALFGHSYGAMIAAHLPDAGVLPAPLVLLDPPVLPRAKMAEMLEDPSARTYDDLRQAIAAVRFAEPHLGEGDIRAEAEALTQVDESAARAILLDNGDWDGGLVGLAEPAAQALDIWIVKGEQSSGSLLIDAALPAFAARVGVEHILTIAMGPHSPQRSMPEATLAAFLRALSPA